MNYGYMWWIVDSSEASVHQGAFEAVGIFGQMLYINPKQHVVIVVWSARPKPTGSTVADSVPGKLCCIRCNHSNLIKRSSCCMASFFQDFRMNTALLRA